MCCNLVILLYLLHKFILSALLIESMVFSLDILCQNSWDKEMFVDETELFCYHQLVSLETEVGITII